VFRDLSESLQALLTQPGLPPELSAAQIAFDRPTDPFAPPQTTVDVFLFEVREHVELRSNEPVVRRVGQQSVVEPPPMRVMCTYLVTAWPVGGLDLSFQEQRLLSQVLQLVARFPTIPPAFLQGSLIGQEPPLPMLIAQPDGLRNPAEFWAAIGNRMRPSILISATIAMPVFGEQTLPSVISSQIGMEPMGLPGSRVDLFRIGGAVTDAANSAVSGASVLLVERGRTTATNALGEFMLSAIPAGNYTLRITSGLSTQDKAITVPAASGDDYNVQLP